MASIALDEQFLAAARRLEERQVTLLERISRFCLRLYTDDLAALKSRQTTILKQVDAVEERLKTSALGVATEEIAGRVVTDQADGIPKGHFGGGTVVIENGVCSEFNGTGDHVEDRLTKLLEKAGATFDFKRVPSDYYARSFEERRDLLGATSVDHLCKSIVMVNTQAPDNITDCSDRNNSKYYLIVIQYTARLNAEKVRQFVYTLNKGKIPKKKFNMRLAPEEESNMLTGFEHNAVTPFGMRTDIPVILSDAIACIQPDFFWLGGGEVDLKLGIRTHDFVRLLDPFIVDCIY